MHIKGKENVVADALSRFPGADLNSTGLICDYFHTLGVLHVDDVPSKLCGK